MASQLPLPLHPLHPLHQLPKFTGNESSREVDDFIREAKLVLHLQPLDDRTAALWLIAALDGRARQEVIRLPVMEVDSPAKIMTILEENWGEQRDVVTLATAFFTRQQGQDETIWEYGSHLQYLWRKVNQAGDGMLPAAILRDTFTRGLQPAALRKDVRHFVRNHPTTTFEEARKEAQRWMQDCSADGDTLHTAGTAAVASLETQLEALTATVASLRQEIQQPPLQVRSCVADPQRPRRWPRRRRRKTPPVETGDKPQSSATVSSQNADKRHDPAAPRRQADAQRPRRRPRRRRRKSPPVNTGDKPQSSATVSSQNADKRHGPAAPRPPQVAVVPRLRVWPCQATSVPDSSTDTLPSSKPPDRRRLTRRKLEPPPDSTDRKDLLPASAPLDLQRDGDQSEVTPFPPTSDSESDSEDEPVLYGIPAPRQAVPQLMPVTSGHPVPPRVLSPVRATGLPTPAPRRSMRLAGKPAKRYYLSARLDRLEN